MSVITFSRRKPASKAPPRPLKVIGEAVTHEERIASAEHLRVAQALARIYGASWSTPAALAKAPALIAEARAWLDELERSVG